LQKPCELEHLLEALRDAYKKRIMNKMRIQEARMNALLQKASGDSALAVLRRLKEIEKGAD
jgi:DNA-binding HxlR family transcriptional regulator